MRVRTKLCCTLRSYCPYYIGDKQHRVCFLYPIHLLLQETTMYPYALCSSQMFCKCPFSALLPEKNARSKGRCKVNLQGRKKLPFSTDCNITLLCLQLCGRCKQRSAMLQSVLKGNFSTLHLPFDCAFFSGSTKWAFAMRSKKRRDTQLSPIVTSVQETKNICCLSPIQYGQ